MSAIHYVTGGTATSSIESSLLVLASVPMTRELRVTYTYAGQILPGYRIAASYGDSRRIATAIASKHKSGLDTKVEEERLGLEIELESLGRDLNILTTNNSGRARLFLGYAQDGGSRGYDTIRKVQNGEELRSKDIDAIAGSAYDYLRKNAGATSSVKDAIRDYIRSGEADSKTFNWLSQNVDPVFEKIAQYNILTARLGQLGQGSSIDGLEETIAQMVEDIKSGKDYQKEIEIGGLRINVDQELRELTGSKPSQYFLTTIDSVADGENPNGLMVPLQYKTTNGQNIPQELKSYYISPEKLARIMTLFDIALYRMLAIYASKSEKIARIAKDISSQEREVNPNVLMRGLFSDDHAPTLTLYPDVRVQINGKMEIPARLMEAVRNERGEIPKAVAGHLGIPEEQVKFEELVAVQTQLMQMVPFPVYTAADARARLSVRMEEAKRHRAQLSPRNKLLLAKYESNEKRIQRDFNINFDHLLNISDRTLEEAVELFGEEFRFIKHIINLK